MARAAATSDVFNAVAEPRRREILELLRGGELPAGEVARLLGTSQPTTSKHLKVLSEVGLVSVRRDGKHRLYDLDAEHLRPIEEWVGGFAAFWNGAFDRLDTYAKDLAKKGAPPT